MKPNRQSKVRMKNCPNCHSKYQNVWLCDTCKRYMCKYCSICELCLDCYTKIHAHGEKYLYYKDKLNKVDGDILR